MSTRKMRVRRGTMTTPPPSPLSAPRRPAAMELTRRMRENSRALITEQDSAATQAVAVVNQTFARHFFKNGDALGHHFGDLDQKYAGNFTIVGITEDTQYWDPNSKIRPMFFLAAPQWAKYHDKSEG